MQLLRRSIRFVTPMAIVLCGCGIMIWLVRSKPAPKAHTAPAPAPAVAVQTVVPRTAVLPVVGYGTVRPKNQVQIVPQVSGELVFSHADLAEGKIIAKGELLFKLDPSVYQARVQLAEAEVRALEALLARQDEDTVNLDARILIGEKLLAIDERDYLISKRLLEQDGAESPRGLDAAYKGYLRQQDAVEQLESRRAAAPHLRLETLANLDAARARLRQVEDDLEKTSVFCPFTARVESVSAHKSQIVTAHRPIATLTDMEAFEIPISIDPRELRWLDRAIQPRMLEQALGQEGPEVKITWSLSGQDLQWHGRVTRFERIDEATRTARMIVEVRSADMVADPSAWWPNAAPTISIGMHCRAELPAEPLREAVLIPWHAIHEDRWVYVFEPVTDKAGRGLGRLDRREVTMLRMIGDEVLVDYRGYRGPQACQLEPGEQLLVSRLADPVVGMQVALQETLNSAPRERDRASPTMSAQFAAMGTEGEPLSVSDSVGQAPLEQE